MITNDELNTLNLSPTNKDYYQIWVELLDTASKISERWDPSSTNEADPGIVLLKVLTAIADKINYNIDKNILEAFMPTAAQDESMKRLCDMLGYKISYYKSATTEAIIRYSGNIADLPDNNERLPEDGLIIPAFTAMSNEDKSIYYLTTKECKLTNEDTVVSVPCIEGQRIKCEPSNNATVGLVNLDANNRFYLPETQVAENGIFVYGTVDGYKTCIWECVNNLNTIPNNTKAYSFGYDSKENKPFIQFPSDISFLIEDGLEIYYIRTSGASGNISARTLTALEKPTTEDWANFADSENFSVTNANPALNGRNPETINQAYQSFKKTVGTFDTLVTCRDYMNKIYNLIDEAGNNLVSNVIVSDIRDDINRAHTLCSFSDYGIVYQEKPNTTVTPTKDLTKVTTDLPIDHFDLVLYPFKAYQNIGTSKDYNNSFKYNDLKIADITAQLDDYKTISHTIQTPESNELACIKNYLKLNARISTQYKVSVAEELLIIENIKKALFDAFNMHELDFGEEIPYETILKVMEQADNKIKDIVLDEPILYTKFVTIGGKEYDTATSIEGRYLYNKLALRNILAGRVELFKYNTDFGLNIGEAQYSPANYSPIYPASAVPVPELALIEQATITTEVVEETKSSNSGTDSFVGQYELVHIPSDKKIKASVSADNYIIVDIDGSEGSDQKTWLWLNNDSDINIYAFDENQKKFVLDADSFEIDTATSKIKTIKLEDNIYTNIKTLSIPDIIPKELEDHTITLTNSGPDNTANTEDDKQGNLTFDTYKLTWKNLTEDSATETYNYEYDATDTTFKLYDSAGNEISNRTLTFAKNIFTFTITTANNSKEDYCYELSAAQPAMFRLQRSMPAPIAEEETDNQNSGITGGITRVTDNKIHRLRTECFKDITELAGSDKTLTLQPNEVIKFRAPSLKTMTPYAAYINYFLKLNTTRKTEAEAARFLSLDDIWNLPIVPGTPRSNTIFPGGTPANPINFSLPTGMCYLNQRRLTTSSKDESIVIAEVNKATFDYTFNPVDKDFYYQRLFKEEHIELNNNIDIQNYLNPNTTNTSKHTYKTYEGYDATSNVYYRLAKDSLTALLNGYTYDYGTNTANIESAITCTQDNISSRTFTFKTNLACFKGTKPEGSEGSYPDILVIVKMKDLKSFTSYDNKNDQNEYVEDSYLGWINKLFYSKNGNDECLSDATVIVSTYDNNHTEDAENLLVTSKAYKTANTTDVEDYASIGSAPVVPNPLPPDATDDLVKALWPEDLEGDKTLANLVANYNGFKYRDNYKLSINNKTCEIELEEKQVTGVWSEAPAENLFFNFKPENITDSLVARTFGDSFIEYITSDDGHKKAGDIRELLGTSGITIEEGNVIGTKSTVWGLVIKTTVPIGSYVDWWYNVNVHATFQNAYQKSCLYKLDTDGKYKRLSTMNKFYSNLTKKRAFAPGQYLLFEPENDNNEVFPALQDWASEFQGYTISELEEETGKAVKTDSIKAILNTVGYTLGRRVNPDDKKAQEGKYVYRSIGSNIDRNIGECVDALLNKYMPATRADAAGVGLWNTYFWPAPQSGGKELKYVSLNSSNPCWFNYKTKYKGSSIGTDSVLVTIQPNEEYQLRKGEALFINYTPSGNSASSSTASSSDPKPVNLAYGPGTIIKPTGFALEDSITKFNASAGLAPWAKTTGFDFHAYGELGGNDVVGMYSISPNSQIDIRDFIKVELKDSINLYWILNKTRTITKDKPYTLQDDEYVFYTDKHKIDMAYYGAGTEIRVTGDKQAITLSTEIEQVDLQEIITKGISAVPWRAIYLKKGEDIQLQEYQYITLVEGDTIKGLTLDHDTTFMKKRENPANKLIRKSYRLIENPRYKVFRKRAAKNKTWLRYSKWYPAYTRAEITDYLDNNWAPVDLDTPCFYAVAGTDIMTDAIELPKFNIASFDTTGASLDQSEPIRWEVRSMLELNVGPSTPQTLYPGHSIKMQNAEQAAKSDAEIGDEYIPLIVEPVYIEKEEQIDGKYNTILSTSEESIFEITTPIGSTPDEQIKPVTVKTNYSILTTRDSIDVGLTVADTEETETSDTDLDLTEEEEQLTEEAERQSELEKAAEVVANFKIKLYEDEPVTATLLEVGAKATPAIVPDFTSIPDNGVYKTKEYNTKPVSEVPATDIQVTLNNFNSVWTALGADVFNEPKKIGDSNIAGASIQNKITVPAVQISSVVPENHYNIMMVYYQAPQDLSALKGMGFRFYPLTKYNIETNYAVSFSLSNITTDTDGNIVETTGPSYTYDGYAIGITPNGESFEVAKDAKIILYDDAGVPIPETQTAINTIAAVGSNLICTDSIVFNGETYSRGITADGEDAVDVSFYNVTHNNVTKKITLDIYNTITAKNLTAYEYNLDSAGELVKIFNHTNIDELVKLSCIDNQNFDQTRYLSMPTITDIVAQKLIVSVVGCDKLGAKVLATIDGTGSDYPEITFKSIHTTDTYSCYINLNVADHYNILHNERLYNISTITKTTDSGTSSTNSFTYADLESLLTDTKSFKITAKSNSGVQMVAQLSSIAPEVIENSDNTDNMQIVISTYYTKDNTTSTSIDTYTFKLDTNEKQLIFSKPEAFKLISIKEANSLDKTSDIACTRITLQDNKLAGFTLNGVDYVVESAAEFDRYFSKLSWWTKKELGIKAATIEELETPAFGNKQCDKNDVNKSLDAVYFLRPGINIIVFKNSGRFEFLADTEIAGALYLSAIDSISATTPDLGLNIDMLDYQWPAATKTNTAYQLTRTPNSPSYEWTNTNFLKTRTAYTLLADILKRDPNYSFYYNCPLQAATAIDINTLLTGSDAEKLSSTRIWYEPNNINNKFVISEIDCGHLNDGLMIARASKIR